MAPRNRLRGVSAFAISLEAVIDLLDQDPGPVILIVKEDIYWHTDMPVPAECEADQLRRSVWMGLPGEKGRPVTSYYFSATAKVFKSLDS